MPVFFDRPDARFIPEPVSVHTHCLLDSEDNYTRLYAFVIGQAGARPGELGPLKALARKPVERLRFVIHNLAAFFGRSRNVDVENLITISVSQRGLLRQEEDNTH